MKIIKIETCDDCPYEDWYQCQRLDIEDAQCAVNGVRDDCPLEDAPTECEYYIEPSFCGAKEGKI